MVDPAPLFLVAAALLGWGALTLLEEGECSLGIRAHTVAPPFSFPCSRPAHRCVGDGPAPPYHRTGRWPP